MAIIDWLSRWHVHHWHWKRLAVLSTKHCYSGQAYNEYKCCKCWKIKYRLEADDYAWM